MWASEVMLALVLAALLVPPVVVAVLGFKAFLHTDDYDRTQWRRENGLCTRCGYDLRASTERCPECGELVPAPVARGRPV